MKDRRLTPKQIDELLSHPKKLVFEAPQIIEPPKYVSFSSNNCEYDSLNSTETIKSFCEFIRNVISRYEENIKRKEEAEAMEMDLKHCMELAQKLSEKEKKTLYNKLTEVLQVRRACKSENEILQPLYNYFSDKDLLKTLSALQGSTSTLKETVSNRTYSCRTSILDDFRP